jgi:hypothetical protein
MTSRHGKWVGRVSRADAIFFVVGVPAALADSWISLFPLFATSRVKDVRHVRIGRVAHEGPVCGFSFELIGKLCLNGAAAFYAVFLPCIDLHLP